jgi:16S rRNA (cytosine967-C5)-methyltransferase
MRISPARLTAFELLRDIENDRATSADLHLRADELLSAEDARLCREIVLGVLRRSLFLDLIVRQIAKREISDQEVAISLRMGAFQLLYLDRVPVYAAINESVELVKKFKKHSAAGLVNAVLRRIKQPGPGLAFSSEIERIAIETSHPRWLIEKWANDLGSETAGSIARANNTSPPVAFRVVGNIEPSDLQHYRQSKFVKGCYLADRFDENIRKWLKTGDIYVQDEGSQLIASLISLTANDNFLDVCASPGGKISMIAANNASSNAILVASDVTPKRMASLRFNLERQKLTSVHLVQLDGTDGLPFEDRSFDSILLDAPCSGTGTIRHNPEIRYRLSPESFIRFGKKQLRLLENTSKLLRSGGTLIYATCSLERQENEDVCGHFLRSNGDFELIRPKIADPALLDGNYLRTWPHRDNMDGFFAAVFSRR